MEYETLARFWMIHAKNYIYQPFISTCLNDRQQSCHVNADYNIDQTNTFMKCVMFSEYFRLVWYSLSFRNNRAETLFSIRFTVIIPFSSVHILIWIRTVRQSIIHMRRQSIMQCQLNFKKINEALNNLEIHIF